jgi:hypothetical protein
MALERRDRIVAVDGCVHHGVQQLINSVVTRKIHATRQASPSAPRSHQRGQLCAVDMLQLLTLHAIPSMHFDCLTSLDRMNDAS